MQVEVVSVSVPRCKHWLRGTSCAREGWTHAPALLAPGLRSWPGVRERSPEEPHALLLVLAVMGDLAIVDRGADGEIGVEEDEVGPGAHGEDSQLAVQPQDPRRVRDDEGQGFLWRKVRELDSVGVKTFILRVAVANSLPRS